MTYRLPAWAITYTVTPSDVWAMTLEQFLVFCAHYDDLVAQKTKR